MITIASTGATAKSLPRSRWTGPTASWWFQRTWLSSSPTARALATIDGRWVKRPRASAARALSSVVSPTGVPSGRPSMPARRYRARNASAAASDHTQVCSRPTGMPSSEARSARSAAARTAMPTLVNRRNAATSSIASGASTQATGKSASKMNGLTWSCHVIGTAMLLVSGVLPHRRGSISAAKASNWASPMVATVRISRGARKNRRTIASSTIAPTTRAAARPRARARK
jgi:hypothetical protein